MTEAWAGYTQADLRKLRDDYRRDTDEAGGVPQMPWTRINDFATKHGADPRQVMLDLIALDEEA